MSKFFTGDGLGCLEIDDEYEFSYELDILDMYQRAAARSAPLSKNFCAVVVSQLLGRLGDRYGRGVACARRTSSWIAAAVLRKGSPSLF